MWRRSSWENFHQPRWREAADAGVQKMCLRKCHCTKHFSSSAGSEDPFQRANERFLTPSASTTDDCHLSHDGRACVVVRMSGSRNLQRELEKGSLAHINWPAPTGGLATSFSRSRSCRNLSTRGWKSSFLIPSRWGEGKLRVFRKLRRCVFHFLSSRSFPWEKSI